MAGRWSLWLGVGLRLGVAGRCPSRSCSQQSPENEDLLESLSRLGVDVNMARRRQPGVLRKSLTNERGLAAFLQSKGAEPEAVASIISRFPRSITRSEDHLRERWALWRDVLASDQQVVSVLSRSPESFFRSSDNTNLQENIAYLRSLGISAKDLHRLLATAPRTFSNRLELNRSMVELLRGVCCRLGGADPERFARAVISRNLYLLIRSTARVGANVDFLLRDLCVGEGAGLALLQGHGALILDLSHESLKRNALTLRLKLRALGCGAGDYRRMVLAYSPVLFLSPARRDAKLDCLVAAGVPPQLVVLKPKVLDFSLRVLELRLHQLGSLGFDFHRNGIAALDSSSTRFRERLLRLQQAHAPHTDE